MLGSFFPILGSCQRRPKVEQISAGQVLLSIRPSSTAASVPRRTRGDRAPVRDSAGAPGRGESDVLTIVVVALDQSPTSDLRSELSLARSAALYADRVVLFSPSERVASLEYVALRAKLDPATLLARLRRERPELADSLLAEGREDLLHRLVARSTSQHLPEMFRAAQEFEAARSVGFVLPQAATTASNDEGFDPELFQRRLVDLLSDPTVHAVCDRQGAALLADLNIDEEALHPGMQRRHRQAELGTGFIARLPAFPDAPLDELLDLKADLHQPLVRYRAAISKIEADMRLGADGWHPDDAIEDIWRLTVEPALQDLEDSLTDHTLVREMARAASTSVRDLVLGGSALAMAVASVGNVAASLAAAVGLAGAAGQAAATGAVERAAQRRKAARSDFYYLQRIKSALP